MRFRKDSEMNSLDPRTESSKNSFGRHDAMQTRSPGVMSCQRTSVAHCRSASVTVYLRQRSYEQIPTDTGSIDQVGTFRGGQSAAEPAVWPFAKPADLLYSCVVNQ